MHDGDLDTARARLEESLAIRRDLGERAALPSALANLADLELLADDPAAARRLLAEAVELAAATRDRAALAHLLVHHGRVERMAGRPDEAARHYAQAWEAGGGARGARGGVGAAAVTAEWLEGVGATVAAAGDAVAGGRLLGAAEGLRAAIGAEIPPHERPGHDRDVAAVRDALGPARFASAWEAGRSMPVGEALEEAAAALR
jgi:tetratricopeptide (TPR) repeat protein